MISTKNLTKQFANEQTIAYRDLDFATGETYVLLGASGCGKSTLLNMIAGILSPTSGDIEIDGRSVVSAPQKERDRFRIQHIGYIFQDFKLLEDMTVEDNLRVLEMEKIDMSGMREMLAALGVERLRRRKARRLSGGEKQRVAIARALIKKPDIILADEPTGNLNYEIGSEVVDQLMKVSKGKTLIAVTHDDRLAGRFDHIIDMNEVVGKGAGHNA